MAAKFTARSKFDDRPMQNIRRSSLSTATACMFTRALVNWVNSRLFELLLSAPPPHMTLGFILELAYSNQF